MTTVLLTGASGFIGSRLRIALQDAGHDVLAVGRGLSGRGTIRGDLMRDTTPMQWRPRLVGIDVVINAAGVFADKPRGSMRLIHATGPKALFSAAAETGVRRIIQISALGAEFRSTQYFETKLEADRHLMSLPIEWAILRPSLVFGVGGGSASLLLRLATAPALVLPRAFRSQVQPVHIDDLVAAVLLLVSARELPRAAVPVVGPRPCAMKDFLDGLRRQLGYPAPLTLIIPDAMVRLAGLFMPRSLRGFLSHDALQMLAAGNIGNAAPLAALLGRSPLPAGRFMPREFAVAAGTEATLAWTLPLLRWTIGALWIWTAVVLLALYPVSDSHALLARAGIPESLRDATLWAAGLLDLVIGVSVLFARSTLIWWLQIALVIGYTLIISVWLPEYWLHPYGPVARNLPLLASMYMLRRLTIRRWNT